MLRAFVILFALGACTQFPELDGTVSPEAEAAAFPALVPLEPLLSRTDGDTARDDAAERSLDARAAALRARADRLRRRDTD
jgi:hypothetical protein